MSERLNSMEIEDVLSSIRRLVSEDLRPAGRVPPVTGTPAHDPAPAGDKLILTPALRVVSEPAAPEPLPVPPRAARRSVAEPPPEGLAWRDEDTATPPTVLWDPALILSDPVSVPETTGEDEPGSVLKALLDDIARGGSGQAADEPAEVEWTTEEARRPRAPQPVLAEEAGDDTPLDPYAAGSPIEAVMAALEARGGDPGWEAEGGDVGPKVLGWSAEGRSTPMEAAEPVETVEEAVVLHSETGVEARLAASWVGGEDWAAEPAASEVADAAAEAALAAYLSTEPFAEAPVPGVAALEADPTAADDGGRAQAAPAEPELSAADRAEAAAVAEIEQAISAGAEAATAELFQESGPTMDEEALRDMVREIVREELQGALGERITRNVRKLVRAEINRVMASREFS